MFKAHSFYLKFSCAALLLLPRVASFENWTSTATASDAGTRSSTGKTDVAALDATVEESSRLNLPFSGTAGLISGFQEGLASLEKSGRRRPGRRRQTSGRRRSARRRAGSRRRSSRRRGSRRRTRRRRRSSQPPVPTPRPTLPPTPPPAPPSNRDQQELKDDDVKKVVVPDTIEYVGPGGCADARTKFYNGIVAAGTGPTKWQMYKPAKADVPMNLQRCIDILHTLSQYTENGKQGTPGVRGMRYGACQGGAIADMGCVCYILGDQGAEGKVRQVKIPGQPAWPQQCCNPPGYGCHTCSFAIPGNRGGGRGPIAGPGGGFAGVCYKLKKSVDMR